MSVDFLTNMIDSFKGEAQKLASDAENIALHAEELGQNMLSVTSSAAHGGDSFVMALTVFVLACFVGYYVVWKVTPALHSPLMAVTNAISSVIIVGALLAAGSGQSFFSQITGFFAVILASINIFGGFIVAQRMLQMFKKKN